MATPAIDVTQVVQVAAQAAQAAAQAATALQRFTDQRTAGGKFSEAGKVVRQPDPYGTDDVEQDISRWTEFYDNFRAWLFMQIRNMKRAWIIWRITLQLQLICRRWIQVSRIGRSSCILS